MALLGAANWEDLDALQRSDVANSLLAHWPATSEILHQLEWQAEARAHNAMQAPRLLERSTRDAAAIIFVRKLSAYFQRRFGSPLYGSVAAIAQSCLEKPVSKSFVVNAVKRSRRMHFSIPL